MVVNKRYLFNEMIIEKKGIIIAGREIIFSRDVICFNEYLGSLKDCVLYV